MMRHVALLMLAIALVLSTATQLRLPGLAIGLGEILSVIWLFIAGHVIWKRRKELSLTTTRLAFTFYVAVAMLSLGMGFIMNSGTGNASPGIVAHDVLAFGLSFSIILALAWYPLSLNQVRHLITRIALLGTLPVAALWLYGQFNKWLGSIDLWYATRYMGWSSNPNQMALLLLTMPFLVLHHIEVCVGVCKTKHTTGWVFVASLALAMGWGTDSGALRLAWTICFPLLAGALLWRAKMGQAGALRAFVSLCLAMIAAEVLISSADTMPIERERPLLMQNMQAEKSTDSVLAREKRSLLMQNMQAEKSIYQRISENYFQDNDLAIRIALISNGCKAISTSPLFGLGPGAYSGLDRPFQNSEAHNSLVDWGTNTGVVGMLALMALLAWLASRLWKAGHLSLLAGLVALVVFSQFHHVLRHPIVWVYLVLTSLVSAVSSPSSSRVSRSVGMTCRATTAS